MVSTSDSDSGNPSSIPGTTYLLLVGKNETDRPAFFFFLAVVKQSARGTGLPLPTDMLDIRHGVSTICQNPRVPRSSPEFWTRVKKSSTYQVYRLLTTNSAGTRRSRIVDIQFSVMLSYSNMMRLTVCCMSLVTPQRSRYSSTEPYFSMI
jgi:hypothetical protein